MFGGKEFSANASTNPGDSRYPAMPTAGPSGPTYPPLYPPQNAGPSGYTTPAAGNSYSTPGMYESAAQQSGAPPDTVLPMPAAKYTTNPAEYGLGRPASYPSGYASAAPSEPPPPPAHTQTDFPAGGGEYGEWAADVRRGFIRKVLFIVATQLLLTTAISVTFFAVDPIKDYITENIWLFWVSWGLAMASILVLVCVPKVHKFPSNYIMLAAFTTFLSVFVGCVTARYSVEVVAMAFAATTATVFGAWCIVMFTKLDITRFGGILGAVLFGVVAVSIIGIFWRNRILYLVISMVSAVLFTLYLIYDLQKLMGDRDRVYSPDDYIFAALNIYLDIINIFLSLLRIIGFFSE